MHEPGHGSASIARQSVPRVRRHHLELQEMELLNHLTFATKKVKDLMFTFRGFSLSKFVSTYTGRNFSSLGKI